MLGEATKRFKKFLTCKRSLFGLSRQMPCPNWYRDMEQICLTRLLIVSLFVSWVCKGGKACLEQLRETVKLKMENGQILLLENMRSLNLLFAVYQDVTAETVASAGGKGCIYNQDVKKMIQDASGIVIEDEKSFFDVLRSSCGFVISNWYNPSVNMPYLNLVGNICNFELSLSLIDI